MSYSHPSAFDPNYSSEPEPRLQIVVHAGPLAGKGFPITGNTITFGRDPENDISWEDTLVSRRHARLVRRNNQLILEDLGSTNGTLVNGQPIAGEHILQPADIISIGTSIFGVKGFSAPSTVGVTQVTRDRLTLPPALAKTAGPAPSPRPIASPPRPVPPTQADEPRLNMLVISGVIALIIIVLSVAAITAFFLFQRRDTPVAQIPTVIITAPSPGREVVVNQPVTVQATASDPTGVVRMELWVDGIKTAEAASPAQQGQPTLTASLQWVPLSPGSHNLEIKAFNQAGRVSEPTAIVVMAVDSSSAGGGSPTLTPTPGTPTATISTQPYLTTKTDLNVRGGPDTVYDLLGLLPAGTNAIIVGRDESRQWWQIRFDPSPTGIGWVAADPEFSTTFNVENLPISAAPPTPTGTPTTTSTPTSVPPTFTLTPIPPTNVPTATPAPSTETPTPTTTPTVEGPAVDFEISPNRVQGGQCVNVSWTVTGVREVYYEGQGVAGVGDRVECPANTTTYRLRIIKMDGSEEVIERTVEVVDPVTSAGTITIEPDDTLDLDRGEIPGDDFKWDMEGDVRHFEVRGEVELAIMGQIGSLNDLTEDDCDGVDYDDFDFVDASDEIEDSENALRDGLAICYRTSEGRLGKLRFPQYSERDLRLEWVTWR